MPHRITRCRSERTYTNQHLCRKVAVAHPSIQTLMAGEPPETTSLLPLLWADWSADHLFASATPTLRVLQAWYRSPEQGERAAFCLCPAVACMYTRRRP